MHLLPPLWLPGSTLSFLKSLKASFSAAGPHCPMVEFIEFIEFIVLHL